jgi:hypothetical protein
MTTSAGAMESIGIPSTRTHACWTLLPSPPLWTLRILTAVGRVDHLKPVDLVTGRLCAGDRLTRFSIRLRADAQAWFSLSTGDAGGVTGWIALHQIIGMAGASSPLSEARGDPACDLCT